MRSVIRFTGQGVVAFETFDDPTVLELAVDDWCIESGLQKNGYPIFIHPEAMGDAKRVADSFMHFYTGGALHSCRAVGSPDMLVTVECVKNSAMLVTVQRREA